MVPATNASSVHAVGRIVTIVALLPTIVRSDAVDVCGGIVGAVAVYCDVTIGGNASVAENDDDVRGLTLEVDVHNAAVHYNVGNVLHEERVEGLSSFGFWS